MPELCSRQRSLPLALGWLVSASLRGTFGRPTVSMASAALLDRNISILI